MDLYEIFFGSFVSVNIANVFLLGYIRGGRRALDGEDPTQRAHDLTGFEWTEGKG